MAVFFFRGARAFDARGSWLDFFMYGTILRMGYRESGFFRGTEGGWGLLFTGLRAARAVARSRFSGPFPLRRRFSLVVADLMHGLEVDVLTREVV